MLFIVKGVWACCVMRWMIIMMIFVNDLIYYNRLHDKWDSSQHKSSFACANIYEINTNKVQKQKGLGTAH